MLETMLLSSAISLKNHQESLPVTNGQKGYTDLDEKEVNEEGKTCFQQSLAIKENKLRDVIFNIDCKKKECVNALSQVKIEQNNVEEIKKPEDYHDLTQHHYFFPISRKEESCEKDKIIKLKEYSEKLCDCLRSIQNNCKNLSQETESKSLNSFENDPESEQFLRLLKLQINQEEGSECPCGEPTKCDSCISCTCSDWEQDLKTDKKEKPEESKELEYEKAELKKKRSHCRCFQSSSDSNQSSKSLGIDDIYNCSKSKIQSKITIATTSVPSTVGDFIIDDEKDEKKFCSLCCYENECQICREIFLCVWNRGQRKNQQLYLDDEYKCDLCGICDHERFRGGTDIGIPMGKELNNEYFQRSYSNIANQLVSETKEKWKEENLNDSRKLSSSHPPHLYKDSEIENLKISLQNLQKRNDVLQKWLQVKKNQENLNTSKKSVSNESNIWKQPQQEKVPREEWPTKNLAIGSFVLFLTFSSHLLGSSGVPAFSSIFKFVFKPFFSPCQMCVKIYKYFPILYDIVIKSISNFMEVFRDIKKIHKDNLSIFIRIFPIFGLIFILLIFETSVRFSLFIENFSLDKNIFNSQLKTIVSSLVKKTTFFECRIISSFVFVKSVFLASLAFILNFIDHSIPKWIINFLKQIQNSFVEILWILFRKESNLWCTSNFIYIVFGFLVHEISKLGGVHIFEIRDFLRLIFNNSLFEGSEMNRTNIAMNNSVIEELKPSSYSYLNTIIEHFFEFPKVIFRLFEIK